MNYVSSTGRGLRTLLTVMFTLTLLMAAVPASAHHKNGHKDGPVSILLIAQAGNATAIATCVNEAKAGNDISQINACDNTAVAEAGSVTLENVNVVAAVPANKKLSKSKSAITLVIQAGDATAVSQCVNNASAGNDVDQTNVCDNVAIAEGGDVILKNVDIVVATYTNK